MSVLWFIPVFLVLAIVVPVTWTYTRAVRMFRGRQNVVCPETNESAVIEMDARHAAVTSLIGSPRLRLETCSLWTTRRDCGGQCLAQIHAAHPEAFAA